MGVGVGEYDKFAVKWLYSDFTPGTDEKAALEAIVKDGLDRQIRFISGRDAIPAGAAHPLAALWDNGADPVGMLRHEIQVRRIGLETFGPDVIRPGDPMASLEKVLVPLYLHHRYQLEGGHAQHRWSRLQLCAAGRRAENHHHRARTNSARSFGCGSVDVGPGVLGRPRAGINPNRKIFEARKRETAALGTGEKLVLGHPLAATIGDSARCMQNLEKVLFTGPKTSDTVTFICD